MEIGDESGDDKVKRRAILLSVCGSRVYKPKEKSYQELVKLIRVMSRIERSYENCEIYDNSQDH